MPTKNEGTVSPVRQPRNLTPLWVKFGALRPLESPIRFLVSRRNGRLRGSLSYDPTRSSRPQDRWRLEAGR